MVPGESCSCWPSSQLLPPSSRPSGSAQRCHIIPTESRGPVPVGRAGHSSPAPSQAAPGRHPHGLASGHLVSPMGTLEGLSRLYPVQLTQATPWDGFGVSLCPVPALPVVLCWSRRRVHPCPLPRVCVSPAHGGQARVACPLNGLQQEQVLGKAQWAGSCRCKGSSSAPLIRLRYSRHRRGRSPRRCHSADAAPLTARAPGPR